MDAKAEKMKERFQKRQEARMAELQRKKENSAAKKSQGGNTEAFIKLFSEEMNQITELLGKLHSGLERIELTAMFDEIMKNLKRAQKLLTDSVMFLPDFEIKSAQSILKKMQADINLKHEELLPKKKFGFKTRTKMGPKSDDTVESVEKGISGESEKDKTDGEAIRTYVGEDDFGFSNRNDCELSMNSSNCKQKDIKLSNLENCTIKLYGSPSALHITNLKGCKIFVGPISRASFVSDCVGCSFSLACQQVRIHTTKDCIFNIHVTGKAIIEDCSNVGFAPYNWSYESLSEDFLEAGLKCDINKWDDVDDFNWLTSSRPSPNWYKVPEESRVTVKEPCQSIVQ